MFLAEKSAKRACTEWIERALNELFLQALQEIYSAKMKSEEGRGGDSEDRTEKQPNLVLSTRDIKLCTDLVDRTACLWVQKLKQANQQVVASWVDETLKRGKPRAWLGRKDLATAAHDDTIRRSREVESEESKREENCTAAPFNLLLNMPLSERQAMEEIKRCLEHGNSLWPADRHIIDQLASEIPNRLYFAEPTTRSRKTEGMGQVETEKTQQSTAMKSSDSTRQQELGRKRHASDLAHAVFDTKRICNEIDTTELNNLLPSDKSEDGISTTIIGALSQVGEIHNHLQCTVGDSRNSRGDIQPSSAKRQARRKYRAAIRERLGQNEVEKNHDPQTYRSKVLKTISKVEESSTSSNSCNFDLDIQPCLLEIGGARSTLCLFSSMEMTLADD
jgi:hypothetical protein